MKYAEVSDWGQAEWTEDVTGVAVDAQDFVYVLRRGKAPVTVFSAGGEYIASWGNGVFSDRPHLISVDARRRVYVADDGGHRLYVFDHMGQLLHKIGSGSPADTGYDASEVGPEGALERMSGGPPFNRPTKVVATDDGEMFVSDGYRNCRIHRLSSTGELIQSWGGSGSEPGRFMIPHSVTLDNHGRVFVCDRENDRIQIFSRDGEWLGVWEDVQRPTDLAFGRQGLAYVTELPRGPKDMKSWRKGRATQELAGRVTVRNMDGVQVTQIDCPGVDFLAPHAIAVDSQGAVYVSEVQESFAGYTGRLLRRHRCLRKFVPNA